MNQNHNRSRVLITYLTIMRINYILDKGLIKNELEPTRGGR